MIIALAGNPNVGKSTLFNGLTGMSQHTGNWPGKTVDVARGRAVRNGREYIFVDLPGTYSLIPHSAEEAVARDAICFGRPDAAAVICDATCLERNLNLVLQILEVTPKVVMCVNLMDEAKRKGIHVDIDRLSSLLGIPVIATVARSKKGLNMLLDALDGLDDKTDNTQNAPIISYPEPMERAIALLEPHIATHLPEDMSARWAALKLLEGDDETVLCMAEHIGCDISLMPDVSAVLSNAWQLLSDAGIDGPAQTDVTVSAIMKKAEDLVTETVTLDHRDRDSTDRKIDRLLTGRITGYPIMLALLSLIFWITLVGANYPSQALSDMLFGFEGILSDGLILTGLPDGMRELLVQGVYRVLAWVVAVMLPPMAIFFPLFTLLEDAGFLPRIAYNLDKPLKRCAACGKQALTMCMGFGCNAAGVVGCRIIDSPRERLLAILTNSFVPCNGRFPTLAALIAMFCTGSAAFSSFLSAAMLTAVILLGVLLTLVSTKLLSKTLLRGVPSSFTLELPPYRLPRIGKVIVRSVFDRTLFVLGRAAAVAAPAGAVIWLMANTTAGGQTLLSICASYLDPFARLCGLDGVILLAFILGFPANEIVIPVMIMAYMSSGTLSELQGLTEIRALFISCGWTPVTAICTMLFSLSHWPCSTTLLTVKKETGSLKWTLLAALLPTVCGIAMCMTVKAISSLFI